LDGSSPAAAILAAASKMGQHLISVTSPGYTSELKYLERLLLTDSEFFGIFGASSGRNGDRVEILTTED
jgi:hypothetical protein